MAARGNKARKKAKRRRHAPARRAALAKAAAGPQDQARRAGR